MQEPVRESATPVLIVLSHLRWDFVFQRPQHLLTRAAREFDVYFVEEPVREPGATLEVRRSTRPGGITLLQPHIPAESTEAETTDAQRAMIDGLVDEVAGRPLLLWYYTPMALAFSRQVSADVVIFDKMDELSAFKNAPPALLAMERELLERADVVFTGGRAMHDIAADRHDNIHCFPSTIDQPHFASARDGAADPGDQRDMPHPRIGFFGVIDERFDIDLFAAVATARPDWHFVVLGPVVKIDPATLPQRPNVHWLGGKDYAALPAYLANWDAGWMPFAINEATRFISPTKTPEFLAAGLPLVSTAIRDVVRPYGELGLVEIARTPTESVAALERALGRDNPAWLQSVDDQLATGSWDRTWGGMHDLIRAHLAAASNPTPEKEYARV